MVKKKMNFFRFLHETGRHLASVLTVKTPLEAKCHEYRSARTRKI